MNYKIVNGTSYHEETPDAVIAILEKSRQEKMRLIITYVSESSSGDFLERGYVGRSTGEIKIPLLIRTKRSLGGSAILDNHIFKIEDVKRRLLYRYSPET